ncbi:UNVERIFIED_CONTAM: hypothetical protein Sradi_6424400 [Sesamum radiatum]|uniref:DUF4283 domain-containing protein n=1 Tax=Sesamum radiatum TaxID=300843 RepID=A0AAW2K4H0_SESRA
MTWFFCLSLYSVRESTMGCGELNVGLPKRTWKLIDDEEIGITLPGGLWHTDTKSSKLCLVGHFLSNWAYRFEALCSSIQSMLLQFKGMEITQLLEQRLLLRFNHIIDKQQMLNGCPWSFEKHILILSVVREDENPMQVDLDLCDFFIHVRDLPLSMMNLGIATLLGNKIGLFRDMETYVSGWSFEASLRIRIGLNVNQPLK